MTLSTRRSNICLVLFLFVKIAYVRNDMINQRLADTMGVSEKNRKAIENLYQIIEDFEKVALVENHTLESVKEQLTEYDFMLQELWGFRKDEEFHTYFKSFMFKREWVGRTFVSEDGTRFTIPLDVRKREFYPIGEGFVDVGDGYYSRFSGVKEIGRKSFQELFNTGGLRNEDDISIYKRNTLSLQIPVCRDTKQVGK